VNPDKSQRKHETTPERERIAVPGARQTLPDSSGSDVKLPTLKEFGKSLLRSRLLDSQRLREYAEQFFRQTPKTERSSRKFAKLLVESGELTRYQAERLLAGRTEGFFLGECKILDRLGAGGMGIVYLAEQLKLGRQVALKILPTQYSQDHDYLARFYREARAAAELKHPNVVQVYDVGEDHGTHYIIMELVRGMNLSERLKQSGPLSLAESLDVVKQVAAGLQHAHEHHIVHRDIKPSNLILEGQTIKILDLGLARKFDAGEAITQEQRALGTPDYMSPEQFQDARSADIRSDLYSLGCTWYMLLTGRPPFPEGDAVGKAMAHIHKPPEPILNRAPNVPAGIVAIINRLMAKQAADRFQTPDELLASLEAWTSQGLQPTIDFPVNADTPAGVASLPIVTPGPAAAPADDSQTLIRQPSTGVPTFLLYLVPVMAALVLGGAYFGIQALRRQVDDAKPIVIEVPGDSSSQNNAADSKVVKSSSRGTEQPGPADSAAAGEKTKPGPFGATTPPKETRTPTDPSAAKKSTEPTQVATTAKPGDVGASPVPVPQPKPAPEQKPKPQPPAREPQTWRVGTSDGAAANLADIWNQLISGDQIRIATMPPLEVPPLQQGDKQLVISADGKTRPILMLQLPAVPRSGQGLWKIDNGSLMLSGVDLYVDLTDRNVADPEVVVFELNESDLHLVNTTITVLRGRVEGRSPVTAVKLVGERPWDKTAKGSPPRPLQFELRNGMVRGAQKVAFVDSRQASLRLENSIVALPGTLIHLFHTRPLEFAHHAMTIEIAGCTMDTNGPLIMVETRPFELQPVKADITVRSSVIGSGVVASSDMPPQVLWQSPVEDVVSRSVKWFGQDNCYLNRADCFKVKTAAGPLATLAQTPDDWARQNLGQEIDWFAPAPQNLKFPREPWHLRLPNDYPHPSQIARLRRTAGGAQIRVGAEPKDVAVPRVYRK
jgi:serine/threonine protein kinase